MNFLRYGGSEAQQRRNVLEAEHKGWQKGFKEAVDSLQNEADALDARSERLAKERVEFEEYRARAFFSMLKELNIDVTIQRKIK